jgi:hypothetical protein
MTHSIDREALEDMRYRYTGTSVWEGIVAQTLLAIVEILDNKQDKAKTPPADADLLRRQIEAAKKIVTQGGGCVIPIRVKCEDCPAPKNSNECCFTTRLELTPWLTSWLSEHDPDAKRPNPDALDGEGLEHALARILIRHCNQAAYTTKFAIRDIIAAVKEAVRK